VEMLSSDAEFFTGDLNGVLNGERKGLERVWDAASILRLLAAGVDILVILLVLLMSVMYQLGFSIGVVDVCVEGFPASLLEEQVASLMRKQLRPPEAFSTERGKHHSREERLWI
jgi:hypothetical protein